MPLLKTQGVILKSQRWGEADRIVTFYTEQVGKIRGVARGARRMKSRFGSSLEPFGLIELTVFEKGTDTLVRISQADILESFREFRENLTLMAAAAHMVNVVRAMTADRDPNKAIFTTLVGGLRSLTGSGDPSLATLVFQIKVLEHTGFRPQMDHCVTCGQPGTTFTTRFSPVAGGLICSSCARSKPDYGLVISPGSLAFIHQARYLSFPTVTRLRAAGQVRREVETVFDSYIRWVIGKSLPKWESWAAEPPAPEYVP